MRKQARRNCGCAGSVNPDRKERSPCATRPSQRSSSRPGTLPPACRRGRRCSAAARRSQVVAWNEPLVLLDTDDIEASRRALIEAGAVGLGEVADGSLAPLGTAPVTNGDPDTGIVDVPGARLAVVELANGNKLGL